MLPAAGSIPRGDEWQRASLGACWLGHATTLLRVGGAGGVTILTDPIFADRAGIRLGKRRIGRMRATALPGGVDDLPPIDIVLLSHAHMDHWDRATLRRLARSETIAVIPRRTRRLLPRGFGEVIEMHWEHSSCVRGVCLTAIQPRHWGARYLIDRGRGYNSYLIDSVAARILFGGDTAHTHAFDTLGGGPRAGVDLAVLGIGNSNEWEHRHASPEQAAAMAARMGARLLMPVHHATFIDRSEEAGEPLNRLLRVWPNDRIVCARVGETWYGGGEPNP